MQYLYLTTTGRRTGLPREIEIWFAAEPGRCARKCIIPQPLPRQALNVGAPAPSTMTGDD